MQVVSATIWLNKRANQYGGPVVAVKRAVIRHLRSIIISLMVVVLMGATRVQPDPGDPDYQRGLADWNSWQAWLGGLNDAQLSGANYWAAQRNQQSPITCKSFAPNGSGWL